MEAANAISFRIQSVASSLNKASDKVLQQRLGIGMAQFKILSAVQVNQRLLQRHIATVLNQTEASISRQVQLLHRKNLLVTQINPKDRRQHITTLTSQGQQMIASALEILEAFQARFVAGLSDKQQTELIQILEQIERRTNLI
jgi:MarR family transcriptional regulator, temperature-dependent positive regulator of motility